MLFAQKIPLTSEQINIWLAQKLHPSISEFQLAYVMVVDAAIDVAHFQQAFMHLMRQNDALHSCLLIEDSKPYLIATPEKIEPPGVLDMSDETDALAHFEAWARARAANTCFTSDSAMLDCVLVKLAPNKYGWYLCINHLISDDYSLTLILQQLDMYYHAAKDGQLDASTVASYHAYMRAHQEPPPAQRPLTPEKIKLFDQVHDPKHIASQQVRVRLSTEQMQRLETLCASADIFYRSRDVTLANILLVAFVSFLNRLSASELQRIGVVSHRRKNALEKLTVGYFSRILAVSFVLEGIDSFRERIKAAHHQLAAQYHDDSSTDTPDIVFNYKPYQFQTFAGKSIRLSAIETHSQTKTLMLNVLDFEGRGTLMLAFDCALDVFKAISPDTFVENFMVFLDALLRNPQANPEYLPMMRDEMYAQVMRASMGNTISYDEPQTILHMFRDSVAKSGDKIALSYGATHLSYRALDERSNQLACYLQERLHSDSQAVGVLLNRSFDMVIAVLAILKAGQAYVPLDPHYPVQRTAYMIENAQVKLIVTMPDLAQQHQLPVGQCVMIDDLAIAHQTSDAIENTPIPEQAAYLLFTSGSTGEPKGVRMPHRSLHNLIWWQKSRIALNQPQQIKTLQFASLSFDVSFQEIAYTLCSGGTLVLISEEQQHDLLNLWEIIISQQVTHLFVPYVILHHLALASDRYDLVNCTLQWIITAGEQLKVDEPIRALFAQLPQTHLYNQYGPSETHVVTEYEMGSLSDRWEDLPPIGRPIYNVQVYVLDKQHQVQPFCVEGELYIGGVAVADGYHQRAALTAERFISNHLTGTGRLYKTGDAGYYRPDGQLIYTGRRDQQIKVRGHRVEVGEIELVLLQIPAIKDVVVKLEAGSVGQNLVAYFSLQDAQALPTLDQLREHVTKTLPHYMLPAVYIQLERLPHTPSGKVDRKNLSPSDGVRLANDQTQEAAQTDHERLLVKVWLEVLGIDSVGRKDHFFNLGGDSLKALRVISLLEQTHHARLTLESVFNHPILSYMAEQLVLDGPSSALDEMDDLLGNLSEAELDLLLRANLNIDEEE